MNPNQKVEIDALRAIFCKDGEIKEIGDVNNHIVEVNLNFDCLTNLVSQINQRSSAEINFVLPMEYPDSKRPKVSLSCSNLPAGYVDKLQCQLEHRAAEMEGQPVMLDLCFLALEMLQGDANTFLAALTKKPLNSTSLSSGDCQFCLGDETAMNARSTTKADDRIHLEKMQSNHQSPNNESSRCETNCTDEQNDCIDRVPEAEKSIQTVTTLLHLDHMRSKQNYIKLIKKWVSELGLTGRLLFCHKFIFILLQGDPQVIKALKMENGRSYQDWSMHSKMLLFGLAFLRTLQHLFREYIIRNRTSIVDVDSKGRRCKERMLTSLCEIPVKDSSRLSEFLVVEVESVEELSELFHSLSLKTLYDQHVKSLIHR